MEEIEITLGQRALPSVHGEQTTASAYAGLGARHVFVMSDGTAGETPSKLAAQTAATAALARIRASVEHDLRQTIEGAFVEARQAVKRALLGSAIEGRAQVALMVVVLDTTGVMAARCGKGRAYVLRGQRLDALFASPVTGGLDADLEVVRTEALRSGDRLLLLNESTVRPLVADLDRLGRGGPAQLAASRLADAARRRGQLDALSVHLIEASGDLPREGPHPALARITRDRPRTYDPDGKLLGRDLPSPLERRRPSSPLVGLAIWFGLAAFLGAVVAVGMKRGEDIPAPAPASIRPMLISLPTPPPPVPDVVPLDLSPVDSKEVAEETSNEDLAPLFEAENSSRLARQIRNHITKRFPDEGEAVFAKLEAAILERRDDLRLVEALIELVQETELKRTSRWATSLLQKLYVPPGTSAPD